jgi:hypothetical protein
MLLALLGELHFTQPGPDSWYNLPKEDGVAYAAQEPWIINETVKVCAWFNAYGVDANSSSLRTVG